MTGNICSRAPHCVDWAFVISVSQSEAFSHSCPLPLFFFFPQETSTPNFTSSSVSGNTQSNNVVRVLRENQVVRQGLGQTSTTPLSMNLIPYGIWGRDSPWQNVEAWLLKLSPFMTCETILIQRNALGGEKCRQFKSLCMCMEQWIQAIIGWPLLTCTEAYRKLMKNLKALNKQVKTHFQMASLVASKEAHFLISGKTETAWTPNSELNHLDALNVIKAKDRQLVRKLEILIQGTETTVQTSSKILLLRLLGTRESAKVPHSPYQKLALPLSHCSECFWAKQHKAPRNLSHLLSGLLYRQLAASHSTRHMAMC